MPGLGTGNLPPNVTLQGGRYVIQGTVGRGGMGAVYKAADTRLGGKVVAIKYLFATGLPRIQQMQQIADACKVRHCFGLVSRNATSCLTGSRLRRRSVAAPCVATGCKFASPVSLEYTIPWQSASHDGMLIIQEGTHAMVW